MSKRKDITNNRFGKLTAKSIDYNKTDKDHTSWLCQCDCGNYISVYLFNLTSGKITSCGCDKEYNFDNSKFYRNNDKIKKKRIYNIWDGIKQRCLNINNNRYKDYGGRGIKICDEWIDSKNFINWAMNNGYQDNLTIERKDVNGNYEPDNCTWITMKKQARNKRNTLYVTYHNENYNFLELLESLNLKEYYRKILSRINDLNWSVDEAIDIPLHESRDKYYFKNNFIKEFSDKPVNYKISKKDFKNKYNITTQFLKYILNLSDIKDLLKELKVKNEFFYFKKE